MCQKWVGIRPVLIVFVRFWFSLGTLWYVYVIAIHQNSWRDLLQLLSSYSSKYVIVVNWYSTQNVSSSSLKLTIRRLAVMGYWWLWTKTSASKSMLGTAQLPGPVLKAFGRAQFSPLQLADKSPMITDQHTAGGSVSQLSQLAKLSPWLTLSTKDITTSFWHYKIRFCFLSNQIMGLYHFSNPIE